MTTMSGLDAYWRDKNERQRDMTNIPSAMDIEISVTGLSRIPGVVREDQWKELEEGIGQQVATELEITFPLSLEFKRGFELGLQTARTILAGSVALAQKGVNAKDVL